MIPLLSDYDRGLYASRHFGHVCEEGFEVRAPLALNWPDFRTLADLRKRPLAALSDLSVQVLRLSWAAGLV